MHKMHVCVVFGVSYGFFLLQSQAKNCFLSAALYNECGDIAADKRLLWLLVYITNILCFFFYSNSANQFHNPQIRNLTKD